MFYKSFPNISINAPVFDTDTKSKERVGSILVRSTDLDIDTLTKALAIQRHHKAQLGQILKSFDAITDHQLNRALSDQHQIQFYDLDVKNCSVDSIAPFNFEQAIEYCFVPVKSTSHGLQIAISDPKSIPTIESMCKFHGITAQFVLSNIDNIHACIQSLSKDDLITHAETSCPEEKSCRTILTKGNSIALFCGLIGIFLGLWAFGFVSNRLAVIGDCGFYWKRMLKIVVFFILQKSTP